MSQPHAGLALSIGVAALFNAGTLLVLLRRRGLFTPRPGWTVFGARVALGCAALGGALAWAAYRVDWIALQAQAWQRAGLLAAVLAGVAALYFAVLMLSGLRLKPLMRRG